MPNNYNQSTHQFIKLLCENSHNIPHDIKFPYIETFAKKLKQYLTYNPNANLPQIIALANNDLAKNSKKREKIAAYSTAISVIVGGLCYSLAAFGVPVSSFIPSIISTISSSANIGYGGLNLGANLNRDIEGRGYLLKHLEDISLHLLGNLINEKNELEKKITQTEKYANISIFTYNYSFIV